MKSYKNKDHMIVDQEVPGSRPGGGTTTFNKLACAQLGVLQFQPDRAPDTGALTSVHYRYRILDLRAYIHHAPARLRIAAHIFGLARSYSAVCLLVQSGPLKALRVLGVGLG